MELSPHEVALFYAFDAMGVLQLFQQRRCMDIASVGFALKHSHGLVAVAALACVLGSCLTVLLLRRLIQAHGRRKQVQLALTSIISGATIWSTHFIAMLAYQPGFEHGYQPILTVLSLGVAVLGMALANLILASGPGYPFFLISGATFGLTVSCMHYLGMSAYLLPGTLAWKPTTVTASITLGVLLGAAAHHRIAYPITKYCWIGGAVLMVLAICSMHFTGMAAFEVQLDPLIAVPPQVISDNTLAILIVAVTALILFVGFASATIETNVEYEAQNQLKHAVLHDGLTGLPNRLYLERKMNEFANSLIRDETNRVAVLTIDLNFFKEINDLHGHSAGDTVLKTVATRLSQSLQSDEFVARAGGDEFVALKRGFRRVEEVFAFADRMHGNIVEPVEIQYTSVSIGAAVGIATSVEDGQDIADLLKKSDIAMYRAKAEQETHICLFNSEMDQQSRDRLLLVNDMRQALANNEFELAYQFQNDLNSQEPVGFEALLRWNHPVRGRVSPADFIPVAEETGLIRDIGLWVLRTACAEAAQWKRPFSVAVNVAPQQLIQPSFLEQISDILMETRLSPERLELEITEASIIDDQVYTLKVMHKLQEMGIRIAMDDFGTGYSSLAMLQAFPFDKIKIDRSFVQDVHNNPKRAAIVRSTLLLAEAFSIPVLAEGVEREEELDFLRIAKCNAVQGFYFGQPMSLTELRAALDQVDVKKAS